MTKLISRELKISVPTFLVIVGISVGFGLLYPEKVPVNFTLMGTATEFIQKTEKSFHLPWPELLVYLIFTLLQIRYCLKNAALNSYLFHAKIASMAALGIMFPLSHYLYAIGQVQNLWIVIAPLLFGLIIYLFVLFMFSDLAGRKLENKKAGLKAYKKRKRALRK